MVSKHQKIVDTLDARLNSKKYVRYTEKNLKYPLGECDVLVFMKNGNIAYYEVKSNETKSSEVKAIIQTRRWLRYYKDKVGLNNTMYGVYYTPTCCRIIR